MATSSQIERVRFLSDGLSLEGVFHLPGGGGDGRAVVVCHPNPVRGGAMDNHVVVAICRTLAESGIGALRFNFRGVGGSEGRHDEGRGELRDVAAAIACLKAQAGVDEARLGLAGYSFGASMALQSSATASARAAALVSLPGRAAQGSIRQPTLIVTGEQDSIAPPAELRRFAESAPEKTAFTEIAGVDHFWMFGLSAMTALVADFFVREL